MATQFECNACMNAHYLIHCHYIYKTVQKYLVFIQIVLAKMFI